MKLEYREHCIDSERRLSNAIKYNDAIHCVCDKGHFFTTHANDLGTVLRYNLCPACLTRQNRVRNPIASDQTSRDSLFMLDCDIFGGLIEQSFERVESNYINTTRYNADSNFIWKIDNSQVIMKPLDFIDKLVKENQPLLNKRYNSKEPYRSFGLIKCGACGFIDYYDLNDDKVDINNKHCKNCDQFMINPYSLGRWLDKHPDIKESLIKFMLDGDYDKIKVYAKDDTINSILIGNNYGYKVITPFDITHNNINFNDI
jgi:hypothetical protein